MSLRGRLGWLLFAVVWGLAILGIMFKSFAIAGPNHVLPTSGAARVRGGLAVTDYLKVISVQQLSPDALERLAPTITTLARAEGLEAHARSVEVRLSPGLRRSAHA